MQVMENKRPRASRELGIFRLIAAGADVNAANKYGGTPLTQACASAAVVLSPPSWNRAAGALGRSTSMEGSDCPSCTSRLPPANRGSCGCCSTTAQILTETDYAGRNPLYTASVSGRAEVIKVLLSAGADPNAGRERGRSPLRAAAYHGHDECVSLLIEAGAQVDASPGREVTALHLAALSPSQGHTFALARRGEGQLARSEGRTPLMWSLRTKAGPGKPGRRTAETVGLLLAAGADPLATDDRGQSALFDAARSNQPLEIRRLLGLGIDVNSAAHDGLTPLMAAVGEKDIDISSADALLVAGADVNAIDGSGATALHWMLQIHETPDPRPLYWTPFRSWAGRMLDLLVRAGAGVNRADDRGLTPLMLAAQNSNEDLISPLLQAGALPEVRDRAGKTARDYAATAGRAWPQMSGERPA